MRAYFKSTSLPTRTQIYTPLYGVFIGKYLFELFLNESIQTRCFT